MSFWTQFKEFPYVIEFNVLYKQGLFLYNPPPQQKQTNLLTKSKS